MKGIYIIGQTERTGTNFLSKLLLEHQKIIKSEHPGEDRLLMEIENLNNYICLTSQKWHEEWHGMNKSKYQAKLLEVFQSSLLKYLTPINISDKYILTKSPSTVGIEFFLEFFPYLKPIILIRDGRNVTESLVQSFNYTYPKAMRQWAESGKRIIQELSKNSDKYLVVKYEDLHTNTEREIRRILLFLKLNEYEYDFNQITKIPIIGSSQSNKKKGRVDWKLQLNKKNFHPNKRYLNWNLFVKYQYKYICGDIAKELGYI